MNKYDHFIYPPFTDLPASPKTPYQQYNYNDYYQYWNKDYYNMYSPFNYNFNNYNPTNKIKKYIPILKKIIRYVAPFIAIIITICTGFTLM